MGTPIITFMLERCARTISQVIIPDLTQASALEQAMHIANLLHLLAPSVEEKSQELKEENEKIRDVLGSVVEVLREEKALSRSTARNKLVEKLSHELKKVEVGSVDISEENHNLKRALAETIYGLDALKEELPMETMSSLKLQIRSALRQQLDREVTRVTSVMALFEFPMETPD